MTVLVADADVYAQLARGDMSMLDVDLVDAVVNSPAGRVMVLELMRAQEARVIAELRRRGSLPADSVPLAPVVNNNWAYRAPSRGRA